jgi:hypothetical protein
VGSSHPPFQKCLGLYEPRWDPLKEPQQLLVVPTLKSMARVHAIKHPCPTTCCPLKTYANFKLNHAQAAVELKQQAHKHAKGYFTPETVTLPNGSTIAGTLKSSNCTGEAQTGHLRCRPCQKLGESQAVLRLLERRLGGAALPFAPDSNRLSKRGFRASYATVRETLAHARAQIDKSAKLTAAASSGKRAVHRLKTKVKTLQAKARMSIPLHQMTPENQHFLKTAARLVANPPPAHRVPLAVAKQVVRSLSTKNCHGNRYSSTAKDIGLVLRPSVGRTKFDFLRDAFKLPSNTTVRRMQRQSSVLRNLGLHPSTIATTKLRFGSNPVLLSVDGGRCLRTVGVVVVDKEPRLIGIAPTHDVFLKDDPARRNFDMDEILIPVPTPVGDDEFTPVVEFIRSACATENKHTLLSANYEVVCASSLVAGAPPAVIQSVCPEPCTGFDATKFTNILMMHVRLNYEQDIPVGGWAADADYKYQRSALHLSQPQHSQVEHVALSRKEEFVAPVLNSLSSFISFGDVLHFIRLLAAVLKYPTRYCFSSSSPLHSLTLSPARSLTHSLSLSS